MKVIVIPKHENRRIVEARTFTNKREKEVSSSTKLLSQAFEALKDIERNNVLKSTH